MSEKKAKSRKISYDVLVQGLDSIDEKVRAEAIIVLSKHFPLEALPLLEKSSEGDANMKIRFLAKQKIEQIRKDAVEGPPPLVLTADDRIRGSGAIDKDKILESLSSKDRKVRLNTVKVIMATRDPGCIDSLIQIAAKEKDEMVLSAMLQAAGLLGGRKCSSFIVGYLTNPPSVNVQVAAVRALILVNHLSIYPYIIKAFTLKEPKVSEVAYQSLIKLGKENLVNLLKRMLFGRHQWMQRAAIRACLNLGKNSRTMRKLLVLATKNGDEYVIAKAQEALDKLQPLEERPETGIAAEPSLLQLPQTSIEVPTSLINKAFSQEDRLALLQEIIDKKDRTKLVDIVKWLEEETSEKKAVASYLMALGRLGGATEVAAIKPYLESSDDRVRANAVEALGMMFERYGMAEIPDLVKPALADRHNRVRANAIVAMEGKGEAAEALEQMVYSGSPTYQRSAVYAISVLNKQEHRPFLDFLSRAKDNMVQKQADEVIEFLADAESVPVLSVTKELKIGDGLTEDGFDEGDDITNLVINPWDSVLLSEEHAAILFRQGMNTKGGGARPMNSGVKQKSPSEKEEGTVAQGLAEALASTFILVTAVLFYGLAIIMIGALLWYIFVIMTEYFPDPLWSVVGCFMAVLLVAVIEGLLPRPVDGVESAVRLSRRDAPALYAMVDKIADQLRVRKPASILIHPYSEIGIYEVTPTPFLPFSSEPQLRIGLASMRALAVSQLRAIVYAELSRVQQSEKQAYLRLVRSIDGTVQQIHEKLKVCGDARVYVNPLFYGAMLYRALVRALSSSTIIRIVLDSDRNASVYAGKEVYKAALNKYSISARLFDQDLQEIIQGASTTSTAGYTENVYSYYRDFLDGLSEKRLVKLKTEIFKCAAPGDRVFPPLQRRLDAASEGSYDNEDNGPDLTQAISLLANSDKLEASFSSVFMNKFLGISRQAIAGVAKKAAGKRSDKTIADETAGDDEAVKENEDSGK